MTREIYTKAGSDAIELQVTGHGGQRTRALACLLADIAQMQGCDVISIHCEADPLDPKWLDHVDNAAIYLTRKENKGGPAAITAVLDPASSTDVDHGLLIVNTHEIIETGTMRCLDATTIAETLGVPVYLPMVGAIAHYVGWSDLGQVKAAVRTALEETAPEWVEPALQAVEAGFWAALMEEQEAVTV